jgi:hypothetical protein
VVDVKHTFRDIELLPGEDMDEELKTVLATMGAQGWELVGILPTKQVPNAERRDYRNALRLFFKQLDRAVSQESAHELTIYERCGVKIQPADAHHARLVIYCPPEWKGDHIRVSCGFLSITSYSPIETRLTAGGRVTAAISGNLRVGINDGSTIEFDVSFPDTGSGRKLPANKVTLFGGSITELDWSDANPKRQY